ncbi:orexin receptor type 2-like [Homalodisca vitripennis]|uniref:G-protein coupled receptors family 1 profile domain-containing protein n=2 Tax=Homalodisca liturata TaxID=320908 RepID=A0A1B6JDZ3_9HEMI|nr:orexin receptor type 2-like [Homalodisca vitripennis]XP_046677267.1 orexin receptor type 2-like [Homalodisca vitripennis]XP_046677271.1 orexin receptor type 2-like [Homalodisca vitripennis]
MDSELYSESVPLIDLVKGNHSDFDNNTLNCTNDYCVDDNDYLDMMEQHMLPNLYECVLIGMHVLVFAVGLVGNALVCVAVYSNPTMRTVTNYFIVNLAVADFMVILFCLPPTVIWDVTETWFLGMALCKIVLYFQTVSVAVSVLTLTFISVDRWYAICFPLKFKSTTSRAKTAIIIIWLLALMLDIPELIALRTVPKDLRVKVIYFTQCVPSWTYRAEMTFNTLKIVLLYTFPLLFMSVAYCQIVRVLWKSENIPGHSETVNIHTQTNNACTNSLNKRRLTLANTTTQSQLRSRRKAAKMLVAVVLMFAVCYFPVHLISILRYTINIPQTDITAALSMISHWLCYANSAVNPLIYNFMSGKYRKEFERTFGWCVGRKPPPLQHFQPRTSSTYTCQFTAVTGSATTPRSEIIPLSVSSIPEYEY